MIQKQRHWPKVRWYLAVKVNFTKPEYLSDAKDLLPLHHYDHYRMQRNAANKAANPFRDRDYRPCWIRKIGMPFLSVSTLSAAVEFLSTISMICSVDLRTDAVIASTVRGMLLLIITASVRSFQSSVWLRLCIVVQLHYCMMNVNINDAQLC